MLNATTPNHDNYIFSHNSPWLKICLTVMFLLAALIRRDEIKAPGHLIEREYNSAIFARAFYVTNNDNIEQWQKNIAIAARDQLPTLEPPLTEYLVSLIYRIMEREELWFARYLTGLFWLVGGILLYKTIQVLISVDAAVVATGYYLFTPWGIIISRSFQPDSLMMMMFMASLYGIVLYFETPSWHRLILAGFITGVTLFLRPLVLFTIFGAFIALSINNKRKWSLIIDKQLVSFVLLSTIFPLVFYGYGIYIAGSLQGQAALSFRPFLLTKWDFWKGWFDNIAYVTGQPFLLIGIIGFSLLRDPLVRFLVAGLTVGYFIFGLFFTFHIHTHPYYHIQLFPIIGISITPIIVTVGSAVRSRLGGNWWMPILVSAFMALYFIYSEVRGSLYTATFEAPLLAAEIGDVVNHSPHSVFISYHYGLPLEYYGKISGLPWPVTIDDPFYRHPDERELSVQERLEGLGFEPDYFIITHFDLFYEKHLDLNAYLLENCTLYRQTDQYLIFNNCSNFTENNT